MEPPAPLSPSRAKSKVPLLGLGLASTGLALFGVWGINQATDDFNIMGFYAYYVIPIGAALIGMVAGSGYGFGSWWTGVRISHGLLWAVVGLQIVAYIAAQYIEYLYLVEEFGLDLGFVEYFDMATQQFSFKERHGDGYGDPMGAWGYAFRLLELGGFVLGGLVAPLVLKAKSYCDACQVYMRARTLVLLPAGAPAKKIKKKDADGQAAYVQENQDAWETGMMALEKLREFGQAGKTTEFMSIVEQFSPDRKQIGKLTSRVQVHLDSCPACHQGLLRAAQLTGQGNNIQRTDLGQSQVTPGVVRDINQT